MFDEFWEEMCDSEDFVETASKRKHHGMNTFYMEHNFSQNEPGREV